ncbi:hypothetical protein ILUMI_11021 [Ignelater luminosus]|uniref:Uncharacterized protein n=1 Tax=Ignelater luminosus TaxID=2038154 RepID=A0A8K0GEC4_IGNLU|nr:hypothetical protein ILUMI_11021 [Ignelater luminosus]
MSQIRIIHEIMTSQNIQVKKQIFTGEKPFVLPIELIIGRIPICLLLTFLDNHVDYVKQSREISTILAQQGCTKHPRKEEARPPTDQAPTSSASNRGRQPPRPPTPQPRDSSSPAPRECSPKCYICDSKSDPNCVDPVKHNMVAKECLPTNLADMKRIVENTGLSDLAGYLEIEINNNDMHVPLNCIKTVANGN